MRVVAQRSGGRRPDASGALAAARLGPACGRVDDSRGRGAGRRRARAHAALRRRATTTHCARRRGPAVHGRRRRCWRRQPVAAPAGDHRCAPGERQCAAGVQWRRCAARGAPAGRRAAAAVALLCAGAPGPAGADGAAGRAAGRQHDERGRAAGAGSRGNARLCGARFGAPVLDGPLRVRRRRSSSSSEAGLRQWCGRDAGAAL